jgi:hypothetical protein
MQKCTLSAFIQKIALSLNNGAKSSIIHQNSLPHGAAYN